MQVCDHILGAAAVADCASFTAFALAVVDFLKPLLKSVRFGVGFVWTFVLIFRR